MNTSTRDRCENIINEIRLFFSPLHSESLKPSVHFTLRLIQGSWATRGQWLRHLGHCKAVAFTLSGRGCGRESSEQGRLQQGPSCLLRKAACPQGNRLRQSRQEMIKLHEGGGSGSKDARPGSGDILQARPTGAREREASDTATRVHRMLLCAPKQLRW